MPIPLAIPLALGGAAVVGGGIKALFGSKQAREAQDAIDNYERQDLENVYKDTRISTLGADLQLEQQNLLNAQMVDAIQQAGMRGVGALGTLQAGANNVYRQIGAGLDDQMVRREYAIAGDNARIRQMQERREEQDLAGLGQQLNVGRQAMFSGIGDMAQGAMSAANMFMNSDFGGFTPKVNAVNTTSAIGIQNPVGNYDIGTAAMMPTMATFNQ